MENSPFALLSPELRNVIWEFALTQAEPITFKAPDSDYDHVGQGDTLHCKSKGGGTYPLALVQTCTQIHDECGRLFYMYNRFVLQAKLDYPKTCKNILRVCVAVQACSIGAANAAVLNDVTVDLGLIPDWHKIDEIGLPTVMKALYALPHISHRQLRCEMKVRNSHGKTIKCLIPLEDVESGIRDMIAQMEVVTAQATHWTFGGLPGTDPSGYAAGSRTRVYQMADVLRRTSAGGRALGVMSNNEDVGLLFSPCRWRASLVTMLDLSSASPAVRYALTPEEHDNFETW